MGGGAAAIYAYASRPLAGAAMLRPAPLVPAVSSIRRDAAVLPVAGATLTGGWLPPRQMPFQYTNAAAPLPVYSRAAFSLHLRADADERHNRLDGVRWREWLGTRHGGSAIGSPGTGLAIVPHPYYISIIVG